MSALSNKLRAVKGSDDSPGVGYWCPGCKEAHIVWIGAGEGPRWGWNGNLDRPTFTPSILVRSGHFAPHWKQGDACWCTYNAEDGEENVEPFKCLVCHTFVTDGVIDFLPDCTHELAGQKIEIPDFPRGYQI